MANSVKQYSTLTSGTITGNDTGQNVQVIHNAASLAATLTITFPATPLDGQIFSVASVLGVVQCEVPVSFSPPPATASPPKPFAKIVHS